MNFRTVLLAICISAATCSIASAHPQNAISNADGLAAGFSHPWLGLDHLLAMIAVGILSVQMGGRAIWALPLSFLGAMILGGAIGMSGLALPLVETALALSVVALGAALTFGRRYPLVATAAVIGAFGLLHGHAHGTEMPAMAAPALPRVSSWRRRFCTWRELLEACVPSAARGAQWRCGSRESPFLVSGC